MDDQQRDELRMARQFRILSIEKTEPPADMAGGEWYRYSIGHESSPINGVRSGTLGSVERYLEEYVETLNDRANYGYSAYATRKGKK